MTYILPVLISQVRRINRHHFLDPCSRAASFPPRPPPSKGGRGPEEQGPGWHSPLGKVGGLRPSNRHFLSSPRCQQLPAFITCLLRARHCVKGGMHIIPYFICQQPHESGIIRRRFKGHLLSLEQVSAALWPSPQVVYEGYFLPQAADLGDKGSRVSALSLHFRDD